MEKLLSSTWKFISILKGLQKSYGYATSGVTAIGLSNRWNKFHTYWHFIFRSYGFWITALNKAGNWKKRSKRFFSRFSFWTYFKSHFRLPWILIHHFHRKQKIQFLCHVRCLPCRNLVFQFNTICYSNKFIFIGFSKLLLLKSFQ